MTSPVAGLMVGKVLPEAESTHLLLMSSLVAETFTVGSMTVVAVAMVHSSLERHFGQAYSRGAGEATCCSGMKGTERGWNPVHKRRPNFLVCPSWVTFFLRRLLD